MRVRLLHPDDYVRMSHEPDHFGAIVEGLRAAGHHIAKSGPVDMLLFDSGESDTGSGVMSSYDQSAISSALERRTPVVWFDYFDRCAHPEPWSWERQLKDEPRGAVNSFARALAASGQPVLYFMRKMTRGNQYPPWVLPLEFPLFYDSTLQSKDEYLARPLAVCGIANLSYPRAHAFIGLMRALGAAADCEVRPHYRRIPLDSFLARHRAARFYVEADASLGSERTLILPTVAATLRITSQHRIPFERVDMVHQVEIGDYDGWIRDEDVEKLRRVLADGDLCYSIYVQGAEFMREHYALKARTKYVLDAIGNWMRSWS